MQEAARRTAISGIVKRKSVSKTRAYIYITTAMVIWATSFLVTQEALKVFTPVMTVTMRIGLATLILLVVGLATGNLQRLESRRDAVTLLCAGFCQPFCYFVCEAYGLSMMNAAVASVILSTIPLFSPLLAYFIIGERVSWYNLAGIVVSFVGVAMVVMEGQHLAVELRKAFLAASGIEGEREELAERVRIVVEGEIRRVVVGLDRPHIAVLDPKPITVCLLLGIEHQIRKLICADLPFPSPSEDALLEEVS